MESAATLSYIVDELTRRVVLLIKPITSCCQASELFTILSKSEAKNKYSIGESGDL